MISYYFWISPEREGVLALELLAVCPTVTSSTPSLRDKDQSSTLYKLDPSSLLLNLDLLSFLKFYAQNRPVAVIYNLEISN